MSLTLIYGLSFNFLLQSENCKMQNKNPDLSSGQVCNLQFSAYLKTRTIAIPNPGLSPGQACFGIPEYT
jgi:hypothetical protein